MHKYKIYIDTMQCYSDLKSKSILTNVIAWTKFKMDVLSELRQLQKDKCNMIPLV